MPLPQAEDFETLPGRGVTAVIEDVRLCGGNKRLMEERGISVPDLANLSREDGTHLGAIAAVDVLRPDSAAAIAELSQLGLEIVMLKGDNRDTAQAGITRVISDALPTDKASAVKKLRGKGRRVLMMGDGIMPRLWPRRTWAWPWVRARTSPWDPPTWC